MAAGKFTLTGQLADYADQALAGEPLSIVPDPPVSVDDETGGKVYATSLSVTTDAEGRLVDGDNPLELVTFPGLQYTIYADRGTLEPKTFTAPAAGDVIDLREIPFGEPSLPQSTDQYLADLLEQISGVGAGLGDEADAREQGDLDTLAAAEEHADTAAAEAVSTASSDAQTKANAARDAARSTSVQKAGDTMTGPLLLPGDPTNTLHAATRGYVLAQLDSLKTALTGAAPAELDAFVEVYTRFLADESIAAANTAALGGKQPIDDDLSAISGLVTQALGRSLLTADTHAALVALMALTKADLGLGNVSNLSPSGLATDPALTAAFAASQDTLALTRLERQAMQSIRYQGDRVRARAADATYWTEAWADLSQWGNVINGAVSGGKLIGATNAIYTANRAINVPAGGRFMARTIVHNSGNTGAGGAIAYIGFSNDPAGGAPAVNNVNGVYMGISTTGAVDYYKGGNVGGALDNASKPVLAVGDYIFTLAIDETDVMFMLQDTAGSIVSFTRIRRSNMPQVGGSGAINNLAISGSGNNAGLQTIGPIFTCTELVVPTLATHRTVGGASLFNANLPLILEPVMADGSGALLFVPPNYDARVPAPVVVYLHGATGSSASILTANKELPVLNALLAAGYIVISGNGSGTGTQASGAWDRYGNPAAQADAITLLSYIRARLNTGAAFVWGVSMGTEATVNLLANRAVGGIAAVALTCPALDLVNVEGQAGFTAPIRTAYGAADHNDFLAKIAGKNPIDYPARVLRDTPMRVYVASDDALADPAIHWYPLRDRLLAAGASDVNTTASTGGHVATSTYQPSNMVAFFEKYRTAA